MKILRKLWYGCTEGTDVETRTPFIQRFACGVGHVINDIMRQLQFSFRLVFFMQVLGLSADWLAGTPEKTGSRFCLAFQRIPGG